MADEESREVTDTEEEKSGGKTDDTSDKKSVADSVKGAVNSGTGKKIVCALCYLWGILFFLPLILYKDDSRAKRAANEGLVLLLFSVIGNAVFGILSSINEFCGKLFGAIAGVYSLLLLLLGIMGIVYVLTDKDKQLPVLGRIHIIK